MDWQDVLALTLVALAAAVVARGLWRWLARGGRSCGGCSACGADAPPPTVTLAPPDEKRR